MAANIVGAIESIANALVDSRNCLIVFCRTKAFCEDIHSLHLFSPKSGSTYTRAKQKILILAFKNQGRLIHAVDLYASIYGNVLQVFFQESLSLRMLQVARGLLHAQQIEKLASSCKKLEWGSMLSTTCNTCDFLFLKKPVLCMNKLLLNNNTSLNNTNMNGRTKNVKTVVINQWILQREDPETSLLCYKFNDSAFTQCTRWQVYSLVKMCTELIDNLWYENMLVGKQQSTP